MYNLADYQIAGKDKDNVPNMDNLLRVSGQYDLRAKYPNGHVELRSGKNLVTNAGETLVAALLDINGSETVPSFIAIGSGGEAANKTDTVLQVEELTTRVTADSTLHVTNTLALTWDDLDVLGTYTIQEMGIFNAVTSGTLFSRFLTQELDVMTGVLLDITWTLNISGVD